MNPALDPAQLGLRDIHLPEAVSWWPLAVGWWVLIVAAALVLGVLVARFARQWRHRAALRALRRTMAAIAAGADPAKCALEASTTMRRFAMTMAGDRTGVAGLVGDRWLDYLDSRWDRAEFTGGPGQLLLSSPYRPAGGPAPDDCMALCELCVDWVRAQSPRR